MNAPQKALLLVGSPKPGDSTSGSLGGYLLEELEKRGVATETIRATKAVRTEEATEGLLAAVASADLVVFSIPLYIDSLPAPAIRALELIAEGRAGAPPPRAARRRPPQARRPSWPSASPGSPRSTTTRSRSRSVQPRPRRRVRVGGGLILAAGGMVGGSRCASSRA